MYAGLISKLIKDLNTQRLQLAAATKDNPKKLQEATEVMKQTMRDCKSDIKKMIQLAKR